MVRMAKGVSRHVVRFVSDGERAYALKEMDQADAEREYAMLRLLETEQMPAVEAVEFVTGRSTADGQPLGAVLATPLPRLRPALPLPVEHRGGSRPGPPSG